MDDNITEIMDCVICCTHYDMLERRPKILPCGHTFCLHCLLRMERICANCRRPFNQDPLKLNDNHLLVSWLDKTPPKKPRFWCESCKADALPECVEEHTICNKNKVLKEWIKEATGRTVSDIEEENAALENLSKLLEAGNNLFADHLSFVVKDEIDKFNASVLFNKNVIKKISSSNSEDLEWWLRKLDALSSTSRERLNALEGQVNLYNCTKKCKVSVCPEGSNEQWTFNLDLNLSDVSDVDKGLHYLLYRKLLDFVDLPKAIQSLEVGESSGTLQNNSSHVTSVISSLLPLTDRCIIELSIDGERKGQIAISTQEDLKQSEKKLLSKGLTGLIMYPKVNVLSGCMNTDVFSVKCNSLPLVKGSVSIAKLPLHPLSIYLTPPTTQPVAYMYVLGEVVENFPLLESLYKISCEQKTLITITNTSWT